MENEENKTPTEEVKEEKKEEIKKEEVKEEVKLDVSKEEPKEEKAPEVKVEEKKPEPVKVEKEHPIKHKRVSKAAHWKFVSLVLAVLLLISIFTYGFRFNSIDTVVKQIDRVSKKVDSSEIKTSLNEIKEQLLELKTETTKTEASAFTGNAVKLDFYVMSQCPFGTQVVDAIAPVKEKLGDALDLNIDFIFYPKSQYVGKESTFCVDDLCSMHGIPEVQGNIVQLCAMKYNPNKYLDMLTCQNKNAGAIPNNWESCAEKANLNLESIKTCYEGEEGKTLARESSARASAKGASGSPTIFLNDESYGGGRQTNEFFRALCAEFDDAPQACDEIPKPKEVNMILLNDERCLDCDVSGLVGQLKSIFPGLKITEHDYSSDEGKELFNSLDLELLPAVLFDETVEQGEGYANVQRFLQPAGDYLNLMIGATFDPTTEICDNEKDDTGNGKVDCDDPDCKEAMECREEKPKTLDLFVMSQCPYGTRALDAMEEVLENFKDNIDFNIYFIADEEGDGFSALHGQPEVDENIRELCAIEHYPDDYKYMDYIWCRNKDITSDDWEKCATDGIDVEVIKECFEGEEGKELLRESIKVTNALGIGASPTWMANNKNIFSGITAEAVKENFCAANPDVDGCENTLSSEADVPAGSC